MATIGSLMVSIGASTEGLRKGLGEAQNMVGKAGGKIGATGSTLIGGALTGGIGLAIGATVGLGAAVGVVGAQTLDMASQMQQANKDMVAQLGLTQQEADRLGDVAQQAFAGRVGDSIAESTMLVVEARRQLGDLADNELVAATKSAHQLADTFDQDYNQVLNSAAALSKQFGLSSQDSMDLIASGFQNGLNNSDDFLDSIGEYSNLFKDAGFSAEQMYNIMQSGAASGVLGTDKIADAVKEMGIRLNEGGEEAHAAFAAIGLDFETIQGQVAAGETTWGNQFNTIVNGLNGIEDPIKRSQAQVGIFGTMAEDLGMSFTEGLTASGTALADMAGATDQVGQRYTSLGGIVETFKRKALLAIAPIGEKVLEIANKFMPQVESAFDKLSVFIGQGVEAALPVIDNLIGWIMGTAVPALAQFGDWFINQGVPALVSFYRPIISAILPGLQQLATWAGDLAQAVLPVLAQAWQLITDNMHIVKPIMIAVGAAFVALNAPISVILAAVVAFATAWANNWGDIQGKTQVVLDWIQGFVRAWQTGFSGDWRGFGQQMRALADRLVNGIKTAFLSIDWKAIGTAIIQGIARGLSAGASIVKNAAKSVASSALDAAKGFLGIKSPSAVFEDQVGGNIVAGLVNRLNTGAGEVNAAMKNLVAVPDTSGAGASPSGGGNNGPSVVFSDGAIIINLGGGDPETVREGAREGVQSALRAAGLA